MVRFALTKGWISSSQCSLFFDFNFRSDISSLFHFQQTCIQFLFSVSISPAFHNILIRTMVFNPFYLVIGGYGRYMNMRHQRMYPSQISFSSSSSTRKSDISRITDTCYCDCYFTPCECLHSSLYRKSLNKVDCVKKFKLNRKKQVFNNDWRPIHP